MQLCPEALDFMHNGSSLNFTNSSSAYSIVTYAVDSNGNIGNYSYVGSGTTSPAKYSRKSDTNSCCNVQGVNDEASHSHFNQSMAN